MVFPVMTAECEDGYYKSGSGACARCNSNCGSRGCNRNTGKCNGQYDRTPFSWLCWLFPFITKVLVSVVMSYVLHSSPLKGVVLQKNV